MNNNEIWCRCKDDPRIEVTKSGRCRIEIIPRKGKYTSVQCDGYPTFLQYIIYETFVEKVPCDKELNHKDLDKSNNSINNLEVVTRSENIRHWQMMRPKKLDKLKKLRNLGMSNEQLAEVFDVTIHLIETALNLIKDE